MIIAKRGVITMLSIIVLTIILCLAENIENKVYCLLILIDIMIVQMISYRKSEGIDLFYLFLSLIALFHFGQVFMNVFGMKIVESYSYDLFSMYSEHKIQRTLAFSIVAYNLIALGGECVKNIRNRKHRVYKVFTSEKENVYNFGKMMFWTLLIPVIIYDITMSIQGIQYGYVAKFNYQYSFLSDLDMYFPFSIICIIAGSDGQRKWKAYYGFALCRIMLLMLTVGNRSQLIIFLLLYELTKMTFIQTKIKWGKTIGAGLVLCFIISFVAVIRGGHRISFLDYMTQYNAVNLFLSEFGSTLLTPILAYEYIDDYSILFGKNYLGATAVVLPLSQYYLSGVRAYMNIGTILNPYSPSGGGLGGSVIGDLIMAFGNYGLIFAIPLGIAVGKISKSIKKGYGKIWTKCCLLYMSYGILLYVRGTAQDIALSFKRLLYIIIIYQLYKYLLNVYGNRR